MGRQTAFILLCLVVIVSYELSLAEIHRAQKLKVKPHRFSHGQETRRNSAAGETILSSPDQEQDTDPQDPGQSLLWGYSRQTWLYSMISAGLVGLSGIFPLLVIPLEAGEAIRKGVGAGRLQLLLSFAVGGLLGDVFLHLLPESWAHVDGSGHGSDMYIGMWVLAGILCFLIIEKAFPDHDDDDGEDTSTVPAQRQLTSTTVLPSGTSSVVAVRPEDAADIKQGKKKGARNRKKGNGAQDGGKEPKGKESHREDGDAKIPNGVALSNGRVPNGVALSNGRVPNGVALSNGRVPNGVALSNGRVPNGVAVGNMLANGHPAAALPKPEAETRIKTVGWLNLLANVIDNFTHGLAIGGSYCISTKTGMLTTVAILLHEVPHEIGDFAILLRAGFNRWKAAQAQMLTATGGIIGALAALTAESAKEAGDRTAWVLPFTSGGFIYIALVTIVPDLVKETRPWESLKQVFLLCCGIGVMGVVTVFFD